MTEQEARTKWCPMARSANNGVSINRTDDCENKPDKDCMCIASGCMMWRWNPEPEWVRGEDTKFGPTMKLAKKTGFCCLGGSHA